MATRLEIWDFGEKSGEQIFDEKNLGNSWKIVDTKEKWKYLPNILENVDMRFIFIFYQRITVISVTAVTADKFESV